MSKYGRRSYDIVKKSMIQRPKQLLLPNTIYGPNGQSCQEIFLNSNINNPKVKENLLSLQKTYMSSECYQAHKEWLQFDQQQQECPVRNDDNNKNAMTQLSLIPTLFWYDNIHVAKTSHYRDFVFNNRSKMVAKGGFVEDKLTQVMVRQVEKLGLVEGHSLFGCYLLDDHSGFFFTGHLDGGRYMSEKARETFLKSLMITNDDIEDSSNEVDEESATKRPIEERNKTLSCLFEDSAEST